MAWDNWPISATQPKDYDLLAYKLVIQLWKALQERSAAVGSRTFPAHNQGEAGGTIDGSTATLTDNHDGTYTLRDTSQNWALPSGASGALYYNYANPNVPWRAAFWDCVIEAATDAKATGGEPVEHQPQRVVRLRIVGQPDNQTLTLQADSDWITFGVINSAADLTGKKYYLIPRHGIWWDRRWPIWAKAQEWATGTVRTYDNGVITIGDDDKRLRPARYAGRELMVQDTGGKWRRLLIGANTGKEILVPHSSEWTPAAGARWSIITAGRMWHGHKNAKPWQAYGGIHEGYYSLAPTDAVDIYGGPAALTKTFSIYNGATLACEDVSRTVFEVDYVTGVEEECDDAEKYYAPHLYKTFHGLQLAVEAICGAFVERKDYAGATAIPYLNRATLFRYIAVNTTTVTITAVNSGVATIAYTMPKETPRAAAFSQLACCFAVLDGDDIASSGDGTVTATTLTRATSGFSTDDVGREVVITLLWDRFFPRRVRYINPKTCFMPAVRVDDVGGETVIDPPAIEDFEEDGDLGIGVWERRAKSTNYAENDAQGRMGDTGSAFIDGEVARHVGDNFMDPFPDNLRAEDGADVREDYYARFYRGNHRPEVQPSIDDQLTGTVTGTPHPGLARRCVRDTSQNWWDDKWSDSGGVLRTESGTATGGSTTTLQDTAKRTDGTIDATNAWWQLSRFTGFDNNSWKGFILEVDKEQDDGPTVTYRTPITAWNANGTLTFQAVDGLNVDAGDAYRIREPRYELNRYEGRKLRLYGVNGKGLGEYEEVVVTHSDDTTLYFDAVSYDIPEGTRYVIVEHKFGWCYQWDAEAEEWVLPTGTDPRGQAYAGAAVDWHADSSENEPTWVHHYGRARRGDFPNVSGKSIPEQLYKAINALVWTKMSLNWAPPHESDPNYIAGLTETINGQATWADEKAWVEAGYDAFDPLDIMYTWHEDARQSAAPFAYSIGQSVDNECIQQYHGWLYRRYSVGTLSGVPTYLASKTAYFAYATKVAEGAGAEENLFDDNGDGVIEDRWAEFDTSGPSQSATRQSDALGDASYPDWVAEPPAQTPCGNTSYKRYGGYEVTGGVAILKWNCGRESGGMIYSDTTD